MINSVSVDFKWKMHPIFRNIYITLKEKKMNRTITDTYLASFGTKRQNHALMRLKSAIKNDRQKIKMTDTFMILFFFSSKEQSDNSGIIRFEVKSMMQLMISANSNYK